MKRLFLLDAYALIFRAYFAFLKSPIRTASGQNISAAFGFVRFLKELIEREKPDMLGVAFDPRGGNFRYALYPEYKANRSDTPEDIIRCVPIIKEILEAMRIPILEVAGYEADDVIGTIATRAGQSPGYQVFMVTPDKDYGQLVTENVFMYKPAKGDADIDIVTPARIFETYGIVKPEQVADILALWGDASDNVPGVPGIGEKGAAKLVAQYGDVEAIIAAAPGIKGKQGENILANVEKLRLARQLVEICREVPIEFEPEALVMEEPDNVELARIYRSLGFRFFLKELEAADSQLLAKMEIAKAERAVSNAPREVTTQHKDGSVQHSLFDFGDGSAPAEPAAPIDIPKIRPKVEKTLVEMEEKRFEKPEPAPEISMYQTITKTQHDYTIITTRAEFEELCGRLREVKYFAFDVTTTSPEPMRAALVGLSIALNPHQAYYIPAAAIHVDLIKPIFEDEKIAKVGFNLKYEIILLENIGIKVCGALRDSMIIHYLLSPETRATLDFVSRTTLDYEPILVEKLIGSGVKQTTLDKVPVEKVAPYGAETADISLQLMLTLAPQLAARKQDELYNIIEEPIIRVLAQMERTGVRIDTEILAQIRTLLTTRLESMDAQIRDLARVKDLNINSPKQLGELLYTKLKIVDKPRLTKTKQFRTDEETLQELAELHPVVPLILEYRGVKKLLTTYVDALPLLVNPLTGRLHTSFNQAVTATGRLSSTNPNLQNIPIRTDEGREIRRAIVAGRAGWKIVAADYSQIELRIMAHLSGDQNMIDAFLRGVDIHTATAAKIYGVELVDVTAEQRRAAKTANFGIIYGISAFGLSQRLNMPRGEAKELIDNYFVNFPGVKKYMEQVADDARAVGYVKTIFKRRRYLPEISSSNGATRALAERNAINAPIQGSAADIMKLGMIGVAREITERGLRTRMLLQVHDEIVLETPADEVEVVREILIAQMSGAASLCVPLDVSVGVGDNWLEAH